MSVRDLYNDLRLGRTFTAEAVQRLMTDVRAQAFQEAADYADNAGDYGYGGWYDATPSQIASELHSWAEQLRSAA